MAYPIKSRKHLDRNNTNLTQTLPDNRVYISTLFCEANMTLRVKSKKDVIRKKNLSRK